MDKKNLASKCLVILGGGVDICGELPSWTKQRCNLAIEYFNENKNLENMVFIATSAGTYHYPTPRDKNNFTIYECDLIVKYLVQNGIDEEIIFREWTSYDTIGNAYYVRVLLTDIQNWYNLTVFTSEFHFERSKTIFDFIFSLNKDELLEGVQRKYNINYIISDDSNLEKDKLSKRICKEKESNKNFIKYMKTFNVKDLKSFHNWLYNEHTCYKSIVKRSFVITENILYS